MGIVLAIVIVSIYIDMIITTTIMTIEISMLMQRFSRLSDTHYYKHDHNDHNYGHQHIESIK